MVRYNNTDNCAWALTSFSDGSCSNWGNPLSEMYLEAVRYFAGLNVNANFVGTDSSYISGLSSPAWIDPMDDTNWCASCNIVVINASDISYDDDSLSMAGLPGGTTPTAAGANL